MTLHTAVLYLTTGDGRKKRTTIHHFAAVDDDADNWLEVSHPAELDDAPRIAKLIAGNGRTRPITATRLYLQRMGAIIMRGPTP